MTIDGGSHSNFDAGTFSVGAAVGSVAIAGAMVAGARNLMAQRAADWAAWDRDQLIKLADLEYRLRVSYQRRSEEAEAELAKMRALVMATARARR